MLPVSFLGLNVISLCDARTSPVPLCDLEDGIGKAMSLGLAKKGLNVLLISRTESKLMDTSAELKSKHPNVAVEHLAIDFSKFDAGAQVRMDLGGYISIARDVCGPSHRCPC